MYKNEIFLNNLFNDKRILEVENEELEMMPFELGELVVTNGRLILADPYAINQGIAIEVDYPNGKYPLEVFTVNLLPYDEIKVAAMVLYFNKNQRPESWEMCLPSYIEKDDIPEDGYYGIATESNNVTICAEQTVAWLIEHLEESSDVLDAIESQIRLTYFSNGGVANTHLPNLEVNLMTAVAGSEKGVYPAYLGYKDDKAVCLVVDFLMS